MQSKMSQRFEEEQPAPLGALTSESDLEEILALAARKSGAQTGSLRERLHAVAHEIGIPPEALREAEIEHAKRKEEQVQIQAFAKKRKAEWRSHLFSYIGVNAFLIGMNLVQSGSVGWAIWPLMGWGIGMAIHTFNVFFQPPEDDEEFEKFLVTSELEQRRRYGRR
jgi:hypothetical protein